MRRTLLLSAPPALVLAWAWLRLESPRPDIAQALWIVGLAIAPGFVPRVLPRVAVAVAAFLLVAHSALAVSIFDARPFDGRHDFFGPLLSRFGNGFLDFYDSRLPFDGRDHVLMHGVILVAVFAFGLALSLAVAARRPVAACLVLVVGAGWPSTLLAGDRDLLRGAVVLAGALYLLAGLRPGAGRGLVQPAAIGVAVVLAAVAASTSPALAKGEFLHWQQWDFYNRPQVPVGVRYVWNSNYRGIHFPKKVTTVLSIQAPPTSVYWRATTLDAFAGDRWVEAPRPFAPRRAHGRFELTDDPLLPARGRRTGRWLREVVTVGALVDDHLIGASVPVAFDPGGLGGVRFRADEVAVVPGGIARDRRYTTWSYAPRPTPLQLARSRARYPAAILSGGYLDVEPGVRVPAFGAPGREAWLRRFFAARSVDPRLEPYAVFYQRLRDAVGRPDTPYAATVALETWLRSGGGFRYDEHPPIASGAPLVDFIALTRRGYCQHFAGAMALGLRYFGIPARVAAGFTSGSYDYDSGTWTVTDHNAHTWVEVWFRGYGWLPFDPTPGRGTLSGSYTTASPNFDVAAAEKILERGRAVSDPHGYHLTHGFSFDIPRNGFLHSSGGAPLDAGGGSGVLGLAEVLGLLVLSLVALVVLTKLVLRRSRYLTSDPRRLAAACRRELFEFLLDQRIELPRSATLSELGKIVELELSVEAEAFVSAASAARFGRPAAAAQAARRARTELRALERQLRGRLTRTERARGLLSIRSLGFSS